MRKNNLINANANTGLTLEKAFEVMDKLAETAAKASDTAALAWASVIAVAIKNHIKASVVAERYGLTKDYVNSLKRGVMFILQGEKKDGTPKLGDSPFAIEIPRLDKDGNPVLDKNGKPIIDKKDYTILKLSRFSTIGDENKIKDFIGKYNITPDTAIGEIIKDIADYKKPEATEATEEATEATEEATEGASEEASEEATEEAKKPNVFEVAYASLQACKEVAKNKEAFAKIMKEFVAAVYNEGAKMEA